MWFFIRRPCLSASNKPVTIKATNLHHLILFLAKYVRMPLSRVVSTPARETGVFPGGGPTWTMCGIPLVWMTTDYWLSVRMCVYESYKVICQPRLARHEDLPVPAFAREKRKCIHWCVVCLWFIQQIWCFYIHIYPENNKRELYSKLFGMYLAIHFHWIYETNWLLN